MRFVFANGCHPPSDHASVVFARKEKRKTKRYMCKHDVIMCANGARAVKGGGSVLKATEGAKTHKKSKHLSIMGRCQYKTHDSIKIRFLTNLFITELGLGCRPSKHANPLELLAFESSVRKWWGCRARRNRGFLLKM